VEFPADIHSNADSAYLGCVNRENVMNMVARPEDLEHGRSLGPSSGERASSAVDAYNTGRNKLPAGTSSASPTIVMPAAVSEAPQ
jgi:type IV pilus biogenesis protein CpaD/CtpE